MSWQRGGEHWYPSWRPAGGPGQWAQAVDAVATEPHLLDELAPVWHALDAVRRGRFLVPSGLLDHAAGRGVEAVAYSEPVAGDGPVLVASYQDLKRVVEHGPERPLVLFIADARRLRRDAPGWRKLVALFLVADIHGERAIRKWFPAAHILTVGGDAARAAQAITGFTGVRSIPRRGPMPVVLSQFSPRAQSRTPRVHIVCQNLQEDRIIPRMAQVLHERLGWTLGKDVDQAADLLYLSGYFEATRLKTWPTVPVAALFTHREEEPPGNAKARLWDQVAERVNLRLAMCRLYADPLSAYGPTAQPALPVERDRFVIVPRERGERPVVGFSGYTYANRRKGEDLVRGILESELSRRVEWRASGRGWPIPTKRYAWADMPSYYQGLDVLVCPSRVEGGPMPVLEALACGVSVVIPRGVGVLDEIPDTAGIHRYERGDIPSLLAALEAAAFPAEQPDPEALRDSVSRHSVDAWVADHARAFSTTFGVTDERTLAAIRQVPRPAPRAGTRGIYCVAFGQPARESALRLMESAKRHMPDIPICLCAASAIGPEDVLVQQPDSDVGGRRAKLKAYELAPAEWASVLYLDADTEVVAPIYQYWQWIESGWEFVICTDLPPQQTLHSIPRRYQSAEANATLEVVRTWEALQLNGGVWACARNQRVGAFMARWWQEWERWAQRDQGALIRTLYSHPLKTFVLGNEWNTFPRHLHGSAASTAGVLHLPGDARRWAGLIPARLDSSRAWQAVERFEVAR